MNIVITGANRGIGQALLSHYQTRGDAVIGTSRSGGVLSQLDVTDPAQQGAFANELDGAAIDLLICNAGVYHDKHETLNGGFPDHMWADTFATNVTGVFLTVQSLLGNLRSARTPKIAIISSKMGSQTLAPGGSYMYRASKAAVLNLGRNLSVDLKPENIAVGIYHPGWVKTDMGGPDGDITIQQSTGGLTERFDELSLDTTGCFRTWDGQDIPY